MVEQLTLNQRVVGSSPTRFTKDSKEVSFTFRATPKTAVPVAEPVVDRGLALCPTCQGYRRSSHPPLVFIRGFCVRAL
jgi:hypothetical protein